MRTKLSSGAQDKILIEMVQASKSIDEARAIGIDDNTAFIGYREGLYDAYFKIFINLGYSLTDIQAMEQVVTKEMEFLNN